MRCSHLAAVFKFSAKNITHCFGKLFYVLLNFFKHLSCGGDGFVPYFFDGVGYNPTHMAAVLVSVLFFAHKIKVIGVALGTGEFE